MCGLAKLRNGPRLYRVQTRAAGQRTEPKRRLTRAQEAIARDISYVTMPAPGSYRLREHILQWKLPGKTLDSAPAIALPGSPLLRRAVADLKVLHNVQFIEHSELTIVGQQF